MTIAVTSAVLKAPTMSASEVLTTLTSLLGHADAFERAGEQIVRDGELDEIDRSGP